MPKELRHRLLGMLLVNLATFVWASNIVLGRWLSGAVGPITLAAARFSVGSLLFALILRTRPPHERRLGEDAGPLLAMALTGVVLFAPTLYLGLRHTTAVNTALINGLGPLITGLLAGLLIREPMTRRQVVGALIGLVGAAWIVSGGQAAWTAVRPNPGDLIVLAAVTLWGIYSVLGRGVMRRRSALSASAFSAILGLPFLLPGAWIEAHFFVPVRWSLGLAAAMVYIGVGPTVVGFLSWNEGVRRLGPSGAMVFYNMLAVYGTLLGALFLGEAVLPAHLVGGGLIILGGLLAGGGLQAARHGIMAVARRIRGLLISTSGPSP